MIFRDYAAALGELPGRPVYLRFGDLPAGGRSSTGMIVRECGVSVYPGIEDGGSCLLDFRRLLAGIDTRYLKGLLWRNRPLFLVEGRRVGVGGMGEPCLSDARIVREVSPCDVVALPDRPHFRALLEAWRAKRRGEDPGAIAFLGANEPDERPLLPLAPGALFAPQNPTPRDPGPTFEERMVDVWRSWGWHGIAEDYGRIKAERGRRPKPRSPAPEPFEPWTPPPNRRG